MGRTVREFGADPVDIHAGAKVRVLRKERGVSQQTLAEGCGVTFQQIQKYERGANRISASMLVRIGAKLNAKPGYFLDDAPGAPEGLPVEDDWTEAQLLISMTGVMEGVRCLAALVGPSRSAAVLLLQAASGRLAANDAARAA